MSSKKLLRAAYLAELEKLDWWPKNGATYAASVDKTFAGGRTFMIDSPIFKEVWKRVGLRGVPTYKALHALPEE